MDYNNMVADLVSFEELLETLKAKIEKLEKKNQWLAEENEKLKDGVWKDEKMKEMREEYNRMSEGYHHGFPISKEEWKKINEFKDKHRLAPKGMLKIDTESSRFHYEFYPTGLGTVGTVVCNDGSRFDFQELG